MLDKYEVYRQLMDTKDLDLPKAQFNPDAQPILDARYLMKKEDGVLESNEDILWRVACWVAKEDFTYDKDGVTFDNILATAIEFYNVMANGYFLPNSPTLRGAGRNASNLSGCFAIPVEDSRHSIFNALKIACDVMAFGGGTGFNFSKIRPHGDIVASTESKASGPISFMKIFDLAVGDVISQGGVRSGAMMGLLHYTHPDIMEFITCKRSGILTNFNISVGVDSKFFELAKQGLDYDLINPKDNSVWGQINAKDVLDAIIDNIWHNGDPGLLFMDRIEESNPTPKLGKLDHVNPCGEISLLVGKEAGESCNLGSINLAKMLGDGGELLSETTRTAVHFLDNVIDANEYVHPEIESLTKGNRKIGLGVMGFADALADMQIPYGSKDCMYYIDGLMAIINDYAIRESARLAIGRGNFPNWYNSTWAGDNKPIRNASLTTIAPTGTLSTILGVNGGIEPFFAMSYKRGTLYVDGKPTEYIDVINSYLNDYLSDISGDIDQDLRPLVKGKASIQDIEEIPQDVKDIFKTAHDIDPITHLAVQDRFQRYIHNNISKSINLPHDATQEDIRQAIMYAYENTCVRGLTMYRDGCKEYQVLSSNVTKKEKQDTSIKNIDFTSRPETLRGDTIKVNTPLGSLYVTINANDDGIQEVFLNIGRSGNDVKADAEALGRAVTFLFRTGISIDFIIDQFRHIGGSSVVGFGENRVSSLPDGLALALEHYRDKNPHESKRIASEAGSGNYCPMCGQVLIRSEKCLKCVCGYSKC